MHPKIVPVLAALLLLVPLTGWAANGGPDGVVNINTADQAQLELLPGVGKTVAERIIAFRESNGEFEAVDELVAVRGIGEKSLDRLRPWVAITGDTTLEEKVRSPRKGRSASEAPAS
jgi:competence protein ComEA